MFAARDELNSQLWRTARRLVEWAGKELQREQQT